MNTFNAKHLSAVVLAAALPFAATTVFASGSHKGGHGHAEMMKEGQGHDRMKIDYASAQEHEFGKASDPGLAGKTVTIDMADTLRFEPDVVRVKAGETVRFVVRNKGKLMHEMVLGTEESLQGHAKMMMKFPGMEHDEPHMAHVDPGKEQVMGWQFTKAGEYSYGCLVPGHFEGGMKGRVIVE